MTERACRVKRNISQKFSRNHYPVISLSPLTCHFVLRDGLEKSKRAVNKVNRDGPVLPSPLLPPATAQRLIELDQRE
jgi:hypothetical protein